MDAFGYGWWLEPGSRFRFEDIVHAMHGQTASLCDAEDQGAPVKYAV